MNILPSVLTLTVRIASEKCQQEKRKTVNGEDILFAMTSLGFENYAEALKIYLSKYREVGFDHAPAHNNLADQFHRPSLRAERTSSLDQVAAATALPALLLRDAPRDSQRPPRVPTVF